MGTVKYIQPKNVSGPISGTRLLVHAAKLIADGVNPVVACRTCIAEALTDDAEMLVAVHELSASVF